MLQSNTTTQVAMLSIGQLLSGHDYPGANVNSRSYKPKEIDALVESIATHGVLQPLLVVPDPNNSTAEMPGAHDKFFVVAGNLRLAALKALVKSKRRDLDDKVPVIRRDDLDVPTALRASMEENVVRKNLHPVEEYRVIVELRDKHGMGSAAIAQHYGLKTKDVDGMLALGRLSPKLQDAWLAGEMSAEAAKAFTLTDDHRQQEAVFKRVKKDQPSALKDTGRFRSHAIKRAVVGDQHMTKGYLAAVGVEAYEKGGGKIGSDLFGDDQFVTDVPLLEKLAAVHASDTAERLKRDGWGWVESLNQETRYAQHRMGRVEGGAKAKKEDRAKAGCLVGFAPHTGEFQIVYGLVKGKKGKASPSDSATVAKAKKTKETQGNISNAIAQRMSAWATFAAGEALSQQSQLAIVAAIAGITARGSPVRIDENGLQRKRAERDKPPMEFDFVRQLTAMAKLSTPELLKTFAAIVGRSLDFQTFHPHPKLLRENEDGALCDLIDGAALNKALVKAFADNASDYFSSVNKTLCLEAITEALGPDAAKPLASKPKSVAADFAVAHVVKTGWLPEMMRSHGYEAPKPKKAESVKEPAAKKKGAKKATAKASARRQPAKIVKRGR